MNITFFNKLNKKHKSTTLGKVQGINTIVFRTLMSSLKYSLGNTVSKVPSSFSMLKNVSTDTRTRLSTRHT